MLIIDIIVLILVAIFLIVGIKRGFIEEIIRFVALIGAFVGSIFLYKKLFTKLAFIPGPPSLRLIIAFVVVYIVLMLSILLIGWLLKKVVHMTPFGIIDRLLGAVFGFLEAVLIVWIAMVIALAQPAAGIKKAVRASKTYAVYARIPSQWQFLHVSSAPQMFKKFFFVNPAQQVLSVKKQIEHVKVKVDSLNVVLDGKK